MLHVCDKRKNIIFVVWDGRMTVGDWLNQAPRLLAEPDWPYIFRVIGDVQTASDTGTIGDQKIERVAALFDAHPETLVKKRLAVLANDQFGKARSVACSRIMALRWSCSIAWIRLASSSVLTQSKPKRRLSNYASGFEVRRRKSGKFASFGHIPSAHQIL
ncbi:MAG TPA: hypothetical protein VFR47_14460 [Anaerolineales bacterium]|nr:hypothetical protein [Anaerolineales bacterium]